MSGLSDQPPQSPRPPRRKRQPYRLPPGLPGGQYKPLKPEDLGRIHAASLQVLERTGVEIPHSGARETFRTAGARLDADSGRVYLSPALVEDAIAAARSTVSLYGRDPGRELHLGEARVYMGTGGAAIQVLDLDEETVRPTRLSDVACIARLVDALDNIHFYLRTCVAFDVPLEDLDVNTYYAALANTGKHVTGNCFSVASLYQVIELASLVAGGREILRERPLISLVASWMISPLRFAPETTEVLTAAVLQEIPVFLSSAPQAGATGPAALAGTLVQINAEELAGLTYCHLVRPGAPVILGYVPSLSDMRTGRYVGGAAEFAVMNAAAAQLGQYYRLPVYNSSGLTEAKIADVQAGYEKGLTGLAAALAGSNYIHHSAGFLESLLTIAYEQYVIDDDINGSIMRAVKGIVVNSDTLSLDVIDQVARQERHYLGTEQSLRLSQTEYYYPHTADRRSRPDWERQGRPDIRNRAREQARKILSEHRPAPLPAAVDAEIRRRFNILLPPEFASIQAAGENNEVH